MANQKMKKLVLFDLDGVLIDSRENMKHAWSAVQDNFSIQTPFDKYFELIGRPFSDILDILNLGGVENIEEVFNSSSLARMDLVKFYPHVVDTLIRLHNDGIRLGVVTSKDLIRTRKILSILPFDFDIVQTPDGMCRGKPAPDYLLLSMAVIGVDPDDTIYVGDMQVDHEAATRSRIDYLHANWGYQRSKNKNIVTIDSIKSIMTYVI